MSVNLLFIAKTPLPASLISFGCEELNFRLRKLGIQVFRSEIWNALDIIKRVLFFLCDHHTVEFF